MTHIYLETAGTVKIIVKFLFKYDVKLSVYVLSFKNIFMVTYDKAQWNAWWMRTVTQNW